MSTSAGVSVTTPGDCEIRLTRLFNAPRDRIYDCYTKPELLKGWLGPEGWHFAICDNDVRAGGRYRWLWRDTQGQELGMRGEYMKVVPPEEIIRTEIFDLDPNRTETIGRLFLTEQDDRTLVTTGVLFPTREARDYALAAGMDKGIATSFDKLDLLLATNGIGDGSRTAA